MIRKEVTVRPLRKLTQAELDSFLEKAADILRGNVDHSEFRGYVFALLFFKRISDVYVEEVIKLTAVLGDETLAKDPKIHNFVVPNDCLWDNVARKSRNQVGTALNDAMIAIERANQPKFDGILTGGIDFNDSEKLPRDKLIKLINHFGSRVFDHANVSDDVFGNAYEYLVRAFASKAGKSSGEFYTPKEVAYLLAERSRPRFAAIAEVIPERALASLRSSAINGIASSRSSSISIDVTDRRVLALRDVLGLLGLACSGPNLR